MTTQAKPFTTIGSELVAEAKSHDSALPLSTQLFPYILIASRTMSLREISEWLDTKHNVSLSAMAISRALRKPEVHLSRLADHIRPLVQYVALGTRTLPNQLLYESFCEDGPDGLQELAMERKHPSSSDDMPLWETIHELNDLWISIPHEVCLLLREYLDLDCTEELEEQIRVEALEEAMEQTKQ